MTINTALEQLLEVESIRQGDGMYISITLGNFRSLLIGKLGKTASPYYFTYKLSPYYGWLHCNLNADTEWVALLCVSVHAHARWCMCACVFPGVL